MNQQQSFKWRHFLPEVILLNVRWHSGYSLSYRDLEEMMLERGIKVDGCVAKSESGYKIPSV